MFELLKPVYHNEDNYKIIDNPNAEEPDLAVIYFSSIGWCSEKNVRTRINNDYYEFHRNPVKRAGRHIYIRDVALAIYTNGINKTINNIDKLLEFLEEKTKGYKVITMGTSSGGYMAMIAGGHLKAQYAISISGPVDINYCEGYLSKLPDWVEYNSPEKRKYFNIEPFLRNDNIPIFHFEAIRCLTDIPSWKTMLTIPNVRVFSLDNELHGGPIDAKCTGVLINKNQDELQAIFEKYKGRIISKFQINRGILSFGELCQLYFKKFRKSFLKIKFSKKESLVIILGITFYNSTKNRLQK